jgi:hypothetical protein
MPVGASQVQPTLPAPLPVLLQWLRGRVHGWWGANNMIGRRLIPAALLILALCGFLGFHGGIGTTTGACDTITGGCPAAHSMSQKLVSSYSGNAFELINPTPAWTGTGSISGTTLTVASTATGTMANGLALSAAGSGVTPGVVPVTYTSGCSGSTCTVSQSQTAASVTSAYSVLDVGFLGSGAWNESTWQSFCYGVTCLVEKIFNQGSGGTANDLIASQITGGAANMLNCTASIVVCAPLFVIDTATDTPMAITTASIMGLFGDAYVGHSSSGFPAAGANASVMFSGLNIYASNCCGGLYGFTENNPASIIAGGMLAVGFANGTGSGGAVNCQAANLICFLADTETGGDPIAGPWQVYDSAAEQRGIWEINYTSGTNTASGSYADTQLYSVSPPNSTASTRQTWLRIGAGGDRSWLPEAFSDGLITADVTTTPHTAAYNAMSSFYSGRSASACRGPLDFTWYMPTSGVGAAGSGLATSLFTIGDGMGAWGTRPLSAWYTGPIITLQNSAGSGSIQTFSAVGCDLDPAVTSFCASGCLVNTLYSQAWDTAGTTHGNVRNTGYDMSASGSTRPSLTLASLGGQPTIHFSGAQELCTPTLGTAGQVRGTYPAELAVVARRTSGSALSAVWSTSSIDPGIGFDTANNAFFWWGIQQDEAANDNLWHSLIIHAIGATGGTAYVDGSANSVSFTTGADPFPANYCIGGRPGGTSELTGDVAEVVLTYNALFNGSVANNAASILSNDQTFYGVTFPH